MKVIKPLKLGFLSRPFEHAREFRLGVAAFAYFSFDQPEILLPEVDMWKLAAEELGPAPLDAGMPKSRAEFLVAGSAHQPGARRASTCPVRVAVGALEKQLYVVGDRTWQNGVPSAPAPFEEMPIVWERAFGGPAFERNPLGRGHAAVTDDAGRQTWPLPNIEAPGRMIRSPKDRPEPAGFGPIDFAWPQRMSKLGTYDRKWLETLFPGLAHDVDWSVFNLASEDQQSRHYFRGDETIVIENMHPERPRIETRLPRIACRCFVTLADGLHEVPLKATTVWLFPHRERAIVVYHGAQRVTEDDAIDVQHVVLAAESPGRPRDAEHYREVLRKRLSPKEGVLELLNDRDLLPPGNEGLGADLEAERAQTQASGILLENLRRGGEARIQEARAFLQELGLDPDEHGPKPLGETESPPEDLSQLPAFVRKKEAELEAEKSAVEIRSAERDAELEKFFEESGMDFDVIREERTWTQVGPPTFTADGERAKFAALAREVADAGSPMDELEDYASSPKWYELWKQMETQQREAYLMTAHHQQPAPVAEGSDAEILRVTIEERLREGGPLSRMDLTGVDLSGMDLSGVDFSGSFLESASFENANLAGATFSDAVLAHAVLNGAELGGAIFDGANLGGAHLVGAKSAGGEVSFDGATLWRANLSASELPGAILTGAQLFEIVLEGADLSRARLTRAVFVATPEPESDPSEDIPMLPLAGVRLSGADLTDATFIRVDVSNVDFTNAVLDGATFISSVGAGACFGGAQMKNVRLVAGCSFEQCDFRGAVLDESNLRDAKLKGCDFSGAALNKSDLSGADLSDARLYRVVARDSLFVRTRLTGAFAVGADLMNAVLQKADLSGTDLRGANLYGADFARVISDSRTNIAEAIQLKTRVHPMRNS